MPKIALAFFAVVFGLAMSGAPASGQVDRATSSREDDALETLKVTRASVLKVEVELSGGTRAFGSGFFVSDDGKAVTNLHVLIGATTGKALVGDGQLEYAIEPLTISVDHDLVLFRVIPKTATEKFRPIPVRKSRPIAGEEVWSLGFPRSLGYTVNKGVVSGIRIAEALKKNLKIDLGHAPQSVWVQTDCTINSGNSGGPLIDRKGEIIGVNTWAYTGADSTYFALSGEHLKSVADFSGPPIGFQVLAEMIRKVKVSHSRVPWLDVVRKAKPDQVLRAARTFRDKMECISCNGKGQVQVKVQTDTVQEGIYTRPIFSMQSRTCGVCDGKKFSKDQTIRVGKQLVEQVTKQDVTHKDSEKSLEFVKATIANIAEKDMALMGVLINEDAVESMSDSVQKVPSPLLFVGSVGSEIGFGSDGKAVTVVLEKSTRRVIVLEPDVMKATAGDRTLVGGLLAGKYRLPTGELVDVIQGGFVIAGKK